MKKFYPRYYWDNNKKGDVYMFKIVKRFYDKGYYSKEDVAKFVVSGKITAAEYKTITGDDYVPAE